MANAIVKSTSPALRKNHAAWRMMMNVLIALAPVVIYCFLFHGVYAVRTILLSVVCTMGAEVVFVIIKNKGVKGLKSKLTPMVFLAPAVTGVILGLMYPSQDTNPAWLIYFIVPVSALFGTIVGKLVFGGTGHNVFNPAAVGYVFMKTAFGSKFSGEYHYTSIATKFFSFVPGTVNTGATFLSQDWLHDAGAYGNLAGGLHWRDLFFGSAGGAMGEGCKILILIALVYLLATRTIDWRVTVTYLATLFFLFALGGMFVQLRLDIAGDHSFVVGVGEHMTYMYFSGGLLFGLTFMLSDPVTMPVTPQGRVIYGFLAAVILAAIRYFGSLPEGMAYSILLANVCAQVIDYPQWQPRKYSWKFWLAGAISAVVVLGVFAIFLNLEVSAK